MSEAANRNTVLKFCDLVSIGKWEQTGDFISDDVVWQVVRRRDPVIMTKKQFIGSLIKEAGLMKEGVYRIWVRSMTVEDERVAAEVEGFGTLPDGSVYQQVYHILFTFKNGQIVETKEYYDAVHVNETLRRFW